MPGDLERLQGTWHLRSLEVDGQSMPGPADARIVIKGTRFRSLGMGAAYDGTVEVDEKSKPKGFQLLFTGGHAAGTRNRGIYKLDGSSWTMCLATRGGRRPGAFATRPGTGLVLQTLTRRKPAKRGTPDAAGGLSAPEAIPIRTRSEETPAEGLTAWEGEWAMMSAVFNGVPMAADMVKWCKRITRADVTTIVAGPQTMLKARFSLDGSANPQRVDYLNLAGAPKGKAQLGIFELTGDLLRVCMAPPGKPCPATFESKPGDGRSFTTWKLITS